MIVNIGTGVAAVKIALCSSRSAALIERKMLQNTTLSIKHHCTLSQIKSQVFPLSDVLACVSIHCVDQRQHSIPDYLTKSLGNTLQTCVDLANEYLQVYNTGADVENHLFCSLHQCNCAGYAMFVCAFVLSNSLFRKQNQNFYKALGQNLIRRRNRK